MTKQEAKELAIEKLCFHIGFWFITVKFDFSGLFPYCKEVEEEDD